MKTYQKIESLYKFDSEMKRFRKEYFNPIVEYLENNKWYGTEKVDGTNVRVHWDGYSFDFKARTDEGDLPKEIRIVLSETFNKEMEITFEQKFGQKEVLLFMEGFGGKVQRGTYTLSERLIGFDIMIKDVYLDKEKSKEIFEELGLEFVPVIEFNNLNEAIKYVKENKNSIVDPNVKPEGLVCYPQQRIYNHKGERIIVKIKKRDLDKTLE